MNVFEYNINFLITFCHLRLQSSVSCDVLFSLYYYLIPNRVIYLKSTPWQLQKKKNNNWSKSKSGTEKALSKSQILCFFFLCKHYLVVYYNIKLKSNIGNIITYINFKF